MFAADLLLDRAMQRNEMIVRDAALLRIEFCERDRFGNFNVVDDDSRRCERIIGGV